ncbi:MAG: hypothetical protein WA419_10295 [Silvibacterium sp.]
MPGTHPDTIGCTELQQAVRIRALTAAEAAHVEGCDACLTAWLDATVTQALDMKPEVDIPAGFAARVAAQLPAQRSAARRSDGFARGGARHWGLLTAILLVAVGLLAAAFADPGGLNSRMGMVFMILAVSEIAGIALWLGPRRDS